MHVVRAKTAGFCMGVGLALQKLDSAIRKKEYSGSIYTLGPLIHNPQVLAAYEAKGVHCCTQRESICADDCVVIRAHGIPRQMEEDLRRTGAHVIDATCPKVKKAQLAIQRATEKATVLRFRYPSYTTPFGTFGAQVTTVTSWPAARAARATAKPIRPGDGFERNRTASMYSRVGPAVTTNLTGARAPWRGRSPR